MSTVRDAVFEMFRDRGMTTIFGNPGSTELPMLADYPVDFRYVLGLQEAVAVGMADGFAQASGTHDPRQPAHRPRRRQRDGGDLQRAGEPLAAAGHRRPAGALADDAAGQPHQPRRHPHAPPAGQVELRAAARRGRARTRSPAAPTSPACRREGRCSSRSRWTTGTPRSTQARSPSTSARHVDRRARSPTRRPSPSSRARLESAQQPGAGRRPRRRRRAAPGTPRSRWPSASACRSGPRPPRAAAGSASPRTTPRSRASCRRRSGPPSETARRRTTWSLVAGSSVFPYYPNIPGAAAGREGTALVAITSDPDEAARAPMGDAIVADVALTLEALLAELGESGRDAPPERPAPEEPRGRRAPDPRQRARGRWPTSSPTTASSCSSRPPAPWRCATSCACRRPGSYYFGAGGGLGFGLRGRDRRAARPARPPGRLRARRGLRPVRDPGAVDRGRLRRPGDVPRPAQRRVRDPQVVRRARVGGRARRASTCPSSSAPTLARGYGVAVAAGRESRRAARRAERRDRLRRARAGRGRASAPGMAAGLMALLQADPRAIGRPEGEPARRPRARRARRRHARSRCASDLRRRCSARTACSAARSTSSATPPTPARTGYCPKAVVMAHDAGDVAAVLAYGAAHRHAGDAARRRHQPQRAGPERRHPRRRPAPLVAASRVEDGGARARVRPGHGPRPREPRARAATAASSGPTRRAPTPPRSAAWSPTTRAGCAAGSSSDSYSTVARDDARAARPAP